MKLDKIINKKAKLPTHFSKHVLIENLESIGEHYKLRVRKSDGYLEEIILTEEEINEITIISDETQKAVDGRLLSLLIESHCIRHAYSYDPYFAVSLSGIQTLAHQIEAVYEKMLHAPVWDLLRPDPRFTELLQKLGLEK